MSKSIEYKESDVKKAERRVRTLNFTEILAVSRINIFDRVFNNLIRISASFITNSVLRHDALLKQLFYAGGAGLGSGRRVGAKLCNYLKANFGGARPRDGSRCSNRRVILLEDAIDFETFIRNSGPRHDTLLKV